MADGTSGENVHMDSRGFHVYRHAKSIWIQANAKSIYVAVGYSQTDIDFISVESFIVWDLYLGMPLRMNATKSRFRNVYQRDNSSQSSSAFFGDFNTFPFFRLQS